jgi:hypothetical protein
MEINCRWINVPLTALTAEKRRRSDATKNSGRRFGGRSVVVGGALLTANQSAGRTSILASCSHSSQQPKRGDDLLGGTMKVHIPK